MNFDWVEIGWGEARVFDSSDSNLKLRYGIIQRTWHTPRLLNVANVNDALETFAF